MAAALVLLTLLLGAPVTSIGAVTTLQWVVIGLNAASVGKDAVRTVGALRRIAASPQFLAAMEENARRNGEYVIRVYPGNTNF